MNNTPSGREVARRQENNNDPQAEESGPSWWSTGLGVVAGVAGITSGIALYSAIKANLSSARKEIDQAEDDSIDDDDITMDDVRDAVSRLAVPNKPSSVNNLNSLLNYIHLRYIVTKKEDFTRRHKIFENVFAKLHKSMKAVDPYYERYSSRCVLRPEEFNMYIGIRVPVNMHANTLNIEESDIVIEPKHASFVQLRAGVQYLRLIVRDGPEFLINRTAYRWLDDRNYILRSKFMSWFQSVVDRALNKLQNSVRVDGVEYKITTSSKDGACTIWITNSAGYRLDVDLVPNLRFHEDRWLGTSKAYRDIPSGCGVNYWIVVPKSNNFGANSFDEDRSWNVDLYEQEKKFIHDSYHLRQGIRLLKKLQDAQQMSHLEYYHIKTLFLWKCQEFPKAFWQNDVATVFNVMLRLLHDALEEKKIRFFWKKSHNMIERIPEHILEGYVRKLKTLVMELTERNNYMLAAKYLLTPSEYAEFIEAC